MSKEKLLETLQDIKIKREKRMNTLLNNAEHPSMSHTDKSLSLIVASKHEGYAEAIKDCIELINKEIP